MVFLRSLLKVRVGIFFLFRPLFWKDFRCGAACEKEVLPDSGPRGGGVWVGGGEQLRAVPGEEVGTAASPSPLPPPAVRATLQPT